MGPHICSATANPSIDPKQGDSFASESSDTSHLTEARGLAFK
jgi:hypothetical protein